MQSLNERIKQLEAEILDLQSKISNLMTNTDNKFNKPTSYVGARVPRSAIQPVDISAGKGQECGGGIIWNSTELEFIAYGYQPDNPENKTSVKSYNKHTHSRYNGGALIIDTLEFVEYDWTKTTITNKHSQQYWDEEIPISTTKNTNGEIVQKIGKLDLVFNADTLKWGVGAAYINIKECYLVEYDSNGNIAVDENGNEKKSTLYNEDSTKSAVVWDKNAKCFRFYATYAPGE